MRKNYKPMTIGILCALIVVMAVGFALLREQLTITGTSHIDSNWNIRITNIRVKSLNSAYSTGDNASADVSGSTGCTTNNTPCDSTTANFDAKLVTPGDSITYEVTVTNSGNLDGVVESIDLDCTDNEAITCATSGLNVADTISHTSPNNTNTVDVTVTYNSETTTQPANTSSTITLTINYQQDLGQVSAPTPTYTTYSVGDTITYKEAAWRVIKNSTASDDYVTLMKETALTESEIGANYVYGGNTSNNYMVYYWSSTCHYGGTYGTDKYGSYDDSGCSGHNDYAGSKIKQVVDAYMSTNNMTNDLKEVDNYKIRLITTDELSTNLGWSALDKYATDADNSNVPTWVYQNLGTNVYGYWTMTPDANNSSGVRIVRSYGHVGSDNFYGGSSFGGVRPVINLLKSAIPAQS